MRELFHTTLRGIRLRATDSGLEFTIYNPEPKGSALLLLVPVILWFAFAVFGVLSITGFVSPETLSLGTRLLLTFWTLAWIVGGTFVIRDAFFRACGKIEGRTDDDKLSLTRSSPLATSASTYEWEDMNCVGEFITTNRPHRGIMIHMKGRAVTLSDYLHPRDARRLSEALNEAREAAIKKQKRAA